MKSFSQKELTELVAKTVGKYISAESGDTYKQCCDLAIPMQIAVRATIDVLVEFGLINYTKN